MQTDFSDIFQRRPGLIKPGLDRIKKAWDFLGMPGSRIPSILVAGTNGKGSTSGFIWQFLAESGLGVGIFNSPHLVSFCERIQCSHKDVSDQFLRDSWDTMQKSLPDDLEADLSFFEITTLLALSTFETSMCQLAVLEVGLGGRWDATNVIHPDISVIVSIGRDHEEFLGYDLLDIAKEKLGILRQGKPLFFGSGGEFAESPENIRWLEKYANDAGAVLYRYGRDFFVEEGFLHISLSDIGPLCIKLPDHVISLPPVLQENFALAAAVYQWCLQKWQDKPLLSIESALKDSPRYKAMSLIGRYQKLDIEGLSVLIDVCHNLDGVRQLGRSLQRDFGDKPIPGLVCILNDKDVNGMLDELKGFLSPLMLFRIDHERCFEHANLASRHREIKVWQTIAEALQGCKAGSDGSIPLVICGSVLAIGRVFEEISAVPQKLANSLGNTDYVSQAYTGAKCGE